MTNFWDNRVRLGSSQPRLSREALKKTLRVVRGGKSDGLEWRSPSMIADKFLRSHYLERREPIQEEFPEGA